MSDDTPTQRFEQPPTAPLPAPDEEQKKSRTLLITLIIVGAVLLAAIIVILILLLGRGQSTGNPTSSPTPTVTTPSPTPTHSATPSPTPTATQTVAPPSTAPTVASFTINNTTVTCDANSGVQDPQLTFSWTSTNASEAFFGVDTTDAQANPYYSNLPPNGNTTNFPGGSATFAYSCKAPSHVYTITVVGNGQKASKSITVKNNGAQG